LSRGPGKLQQVLLALFFTHIGQPLTFDEIKELTGTRERTLDEIFNGTGTQWQHRERSLRRALTNLVRRGGRFSQILAIGKGGPSDPY
jgi:hypothetical protein